jgi:hypothetical protein
VSVEDGLDELWVAVKCQSNLEIAGSPRNVLRYSLWCSEQEVEHWMVEGPYQVTEINQTPNACSPSQGVRLWGISFTVKRETAQTIR